MPSDILLSLGTNEQQQISRTDFFRKKLLSMIFAALVIQNPVISLEVNSYKVKIYFLISTCNVQNDFDATQCSFMYTYTYRYYHPNGHVS